MGGTVAVLRSLGVCFATLLASGLAVEFGVRRGVVVPSDEEGRATAEPPEPILFSACFRTSVESDLVVPRSAGVRRFAREAGTERQFAVESWPPTTSGPLLVDLVQVLEQLAESGVERRLLTGLGDFSLP